MNEFECHCGCRMPDSARANIVALVEQVLPVLVVLALLAVLLVAWVAATDQAVISPDNERTAR